MHHSLLELGKPKEAGLNPSCRLEVPGSSFFSSTGCRNRIGRVATGGSSTMLTGYPAGTVGASDPGGPGDGVGAGVGSWGVVVGVGAREK